MCIRLQKEENICIDTCENKSCKNKSSIWSIFLGKERRYCDDIPKRNPDKSWWHKVWYFFFYRDKCFWLFFIYFSITHILFFPEAYAKKFDHTSQTTHYVCFERSIAWDFLESIPWEKLIVDKKIHSYGYKKKNIGDDKNEWNHSLTRSEK